MRLLRIQVPDFRVLKDVDIVFEKDFIPNIFPLGSQNGGGKSTLLQLIFTLLHCSNKPSEISFLQNMIMGFKLHKDNEKRVLAIIDLLDNSKNIQIEFFSCRDYYIKKILISDGVDKDNDQDYDEFSFSALPKYEIIKQRLYKVIEQREIVKKAIDSLKALENNVSDTEKKIDLDRILRDIRRLEIPQMNKFMLRRRGEITEFQTEIELQLLELNKSFIKLKDERDRLLRISEKILSILKERNILHIVNYSSEGNDDETEVLLCRVENIDIEEAKSFLDDLSRKVFLAAPSTQVFLFLSKEVRKTLFKEQNILSSNNIYNFRLQEAKSKLTGLFTYDFIAVDLLIDSFKAARDRDFKEAIETGEYGSNYKMLLNELNFMLGNKKVNLRTDLSGVSFKMDKDDETVELNPEDLSHGELKRLSIYMWLKYRNIEDSIVLMDEIEIALHPDWQYRIVSDLTEWAPSNQYILATHSYELCQALTPSHVKELEPRLLKQV